MINLPRDLEVYLYENLGIKVTTKKWFEAKRLPLFLRDLYSIFECELLGIPYLLAISKSGEEQTPASVRKHLNLLYEKWDREVIYLHPSISAYNRKRLIEQKVSFVVPGNQMYLPCLGIDFREHIRKQRLSRTSKFSPSTQAVVLYALHNRITSEATPSSLAEELGYSPMTLTRAFDELEAVGLAEVKMEGRERILRFDLDKRVLWQKAQEHLRSPVKKRILIQTINNQRPKAMAGLTALSHYSMLAEPRIEVFALSTEQWKSLKHSGDFIEVRFPEPGSYEIEIWNYAPQLLAQQNIVDRLSLYLSLKNSKDERVESALDELLEGFEW